MDNFCVVPWFSREIDLASGDDKICCWLSGNPTRTDLQKKFLANSKPSECKRCWQSESAGLESRRMMENRFLDYKMDRDLSSIEKDVVEGQSEVSMYQLFLGSTCNGMCVTCGPSASSSWKSLLKKSISIRQENAVIDQNYKKFSEEINWAKARKINLLGGEPFLIDRSFNILEQLLLAGNCDCNISFVTNGSVKLKAEQIKLIKNFSDINCCISIDGIGRTFEYLRYPLSWETLQENLKTYRDIFKELTVSFTVSNLNYHERPQIIEWFQSQGLLYIENYVEHPSWFNHQVGPGHPNWEKFIEEINIQDNLKGIRIKDYIPYIDDLINRA